MASQRYHPSITDNCETTCCTANPLKTILWEQKQKVYQTSRVSIV